MKKGLMTLGVGAGLMYFLDPDQGPRRRSIARDKFIATRNDLADWMTEMSRELGNRWYGIRSELQALVTPEEVTDEQLEARIRSHLGRLTSHPKAIHAYVRDHDVILEGPVLAAEALHLVSGIRRVRGVHRVENRLEIHDRADIPALQGPGRIQEREWSTTRRVISGATGGALALYGLRRGGISGAALALFGVSLLTHGVTNQTIGQYMGSGDGDHGRRPMRRRSRQPVSSLPSGGI